MYSLNDMFDIVDSVCVGWNRICEPSFRTAILILSPLFDSHNKCTFVSVPLGNKAETGHSRSNPEPDSES